MHLGPMPRNERLPALLKAATVCAFLAVLSGCASGMAGISASVPGGFFASRPAGSPLPVTMFVASTRRDDHRVADTIADGGVHHSLLTITVPPGHQAGVIETPTFGKPSPKRHFALEAARALSPERFTSEIATHLSGRVGTNRDVLLYVHGFNTSLDEAQMRLTQIVADARFGGVPVLFTWPSQSNLFSYVSDKDRATASRDALENLMKELAAVPGVGRVHVLAHSMGAWLAMEALRENAIAGHADLDGKLGDVMLAAPDIDLTVFQQQIARLGKSIRVSVFVSRADRALSLSSRIAGDRQRVGAMDPTKPRDADALQRLGVRVYDLSSFSDGFIGHGVYADAPDVIRSIGAQLAEPRKEDATTVAGADSWGEAPPAAPPANPATPSGPGAPATPVPAPAPSPNLAPMAAPEASPAPPPAQ